MRYDQWRFGWCWYTDDKVNCYKSNSYRKWKLKRKKFLRNQKKSRKNNRKK